MDGFSIHAVDQEELKKFYQAYKEGKLTPHTQPSEKTLEMFNNMNDKIDNLKDEISNIKIDIAKLPEVLVEKFDCKYASKKTEVIVYGMVALILVAVFGQIISNVVVSQKRNVLSEQDVKRIIEENYTQQK
jgi:hypothetical protein